MDFRRGSGRNVSRGPVLAILVSRAPGPSSKTRLAKRLGAVRAKELAGAMVQDCWDVLGRAGFRRVLATDGPVAAYPFSPDESWDQGSGDLADRLTALTLRGLTEARAVIFLGGDSPDLPASCVVAAADALAETGAVFIPSTDGGFVLMGLRASVDLKAVRWSTAHTLHDATQAARAAGLSVAHLPTHFDVDEVADIDRLGPCTTRDVWERIR